MCGCNALKIGRLPRKAELVLEEVVTIKKNVISIKYRVSVNAAALPGSVCHFVQSSNCTEMHQINRCEFVLRAKTRHNNNLRSSLKTSVASLTGPCFRGAASFRFSVDHNQVWRSMPSTNTQAHRLLIHRRLRMLGRGGGGSTNQRYRWLLSHWDCWET